MSWRHKHTNMESKCESSGSCLCEAPRASRRPWPIEIGTSAQSSPHFPLLWRHATQRLHLLLQSTNYAIHPSLSQIQLVMSSFLASIKNASDLLHLSSEPLPTAPDGLTDTEAASTSSGRPADHGVIYKLVDDIQGAIHRGDPVELDEQTLVGSIPLQRCRSADLPGYPRPKACRGGRYPPCQDYRYR